MEMNSEFSQLNCQQRKKKHEEEEEEEESRENWIYLK